MAKPIQWAPREKRRAVTSAIGNSFLKTVTEPTTNSDSNLKAFTGAHHAAGLVDEILKLKVGDTLNSADLKRHVPKVALRKIRIEISTAGRDARLCRIIDHGSGMTCQELDEKFTKYASAKALGQRTRSLFGRGALDVLLHHKESVIYSVKGGILARARFYWDKNGEPMCDAMNLGSATKKRLSEHGLPYNILDHGTVVQFRITEGTHIPGEEQILAKISSFYMLRLIAADPNSEVTVVRKRGTGSAVGTLSYDFPVGKVIARASDDLWLNEFGTFPVDILVARSDAALVNDPANIERRENGLLFVDDNDAVLDLTLLPEYDKNPYLQHLFGVVRITGIRTVLENKLEAPEAEAVLTITRDGFDRKNSITQKLFALVEHYVKPIYDAEEKSQRTGDTHRSERLDKRINQVLKVLNQFNAEETDEEGTGKKADESDEPIFFAVDSARLYAGQPRRFTIYVNLGRVKDGEIILFESDEVDFKIDPDSEVVRSRKNQSHQRLQLTVQCDRKGAKGTITAISLDSAGKEIKAALRILGVDDPPVFVPPDDIAFTAVHVAGEPNRNTNAALLVNLKVFSGMPEIAFQLDEVVGSVSFGDRKDTTTIRVKSENIMSGHSDVARIVVPFTATGWGQSAVLRARARRADGVMAQAKCKLSFERPKGSDKFSNFHYEDLGRPVLGDVAGDKIYVNSGYALHQRIFGADEEAFNRSLETDQIAQSRAAAVLVETAVFHTATTKFNAGGKKGLHIDPEDPIGSLRPYLDESKMKLEPKVFQALVDKREVPASAVSSQASTQIGTAVPA